MRKITEPQKLMRRTVRCDWWCRHCHKQFGSENVSLYCTKLPDVIKPNWFFAAMALLDHLRDCLHEEYTDRLVQRYGFDFLSNTEIYNWFNDHAVVHKTLIHEEELEAP
ncbi:MAG: hypothetical protein M1472_04320 [Planctomycetes bacterium]|jgi:hypothetical protein|nr:hypothetical protein [Planctomycetota bacterium]